MYVLLSYPLSEQTPLYRTNPPFKIRPDLQLAKGNGCNQYVVEFCNHDGTHVDVPNHFDPDGKSVSEYDISDFIFHRPAVVSIPKRDSELITAKEIEDRRGMIENCDLLLIRTGFWAVRRTDPRRYVEKNPGISVEMARLLIQGFPSLRAIGLDLPSAAANEHIEEGAEAHRVLIGHKISKKDFFIIEDVDLRVGLPPLKKVFVIPLFMVGIDSTPCTIFAEPRSDDHPQPISLS